jgi:NTP pyrophosphatase (non-canonical NTP hydrolase)
MHWERYQLFPAMSEKEIKDFHEKYSKLLWPCVKERGGCGAPNSVKWENIETEIPMVTGDEPNKDEVIPLRLDHDVAEAIHKDIKYKSISLKKKQIYNDIFEKNGAEYQAGVCIEELAELTKALTKFIRHKGSRMKIAEELADVNICVESLIQHFEFEKEVQMFMTFKLNRLKLMYIDGEET